MFVFVHSPTDDCWTRFGCVDTKSGDAPTEKCPWSFDPWLKNQVVCARRVCNIYLHYMFHLILIFCRWKSQWSNWHIICYHKWRFRRTCHHVVVTSGLGAPMEKHNAAQPRTYQYGSIGYGTSSGNTNLYVRINYHIKTHFLPRNAYTILQLNTYKSWSYAHEIIKYKHDTIKIQTTPVLHILPCVFPRISQIRIFLERWQKVGSETGAKNRPKFHPRFWFDQSVHNGEPSNTK